MDRRRFIVGTAGLALSAQFSRAQNAANIRASPWLDGSYAALPTHAQQTDGLDAEALAAHAKPRMVNAMSVTGLPLKLNKFDEKIVAVLKENGIVGVSFALAVDRRLVVTRGYGDLSSHHKIPATPTSPGYLGSITKPLCAMAGLTLVEAGKLKLDQKVLDILPLQPLLKGEEQRQPEIDEVTVRMLMNHTSGLFNAVEVLFDRDYYRQLAAQGRLKLVHGDISQYDLVRRGMSKPFVSKPGSEWHYSGQGPQVLGRIIEKLSGQRLDKYINSIVLRPMGIKHHATLSYLAPAQFALIAAGQASKTQTFIPSPYNESKRVCESWAFKLPSDAPYGNYWGHADACGSSLLSAVELLRFVTFCPDLVGKELWAEAMTPPVLRDRDGNQSRPGHGLGWGVSNHSGRYQFGHAGAFGGIRAFCESTWDDVQYGVLMAGDRDMAFNTIKEQVLMLGRFLRDEKAATVGWQRYGWDSEK